MKHLLKTVTAIAAFAVASQASAATYLPGGPADVNFAVTGNISSGPVTAAIKSIAVAGGAFTDYFIFAIDQTGTGTGAVTTSFNDIAFSVGLQFSTVTIEKGTFSGGIFTPFADPIANDKVSATFTTNPATPLSTSASIGTYGIQQGIFNRITINGQSGGAGSYGGNITFIPTSPVPEAATWAMMLAGFGAVGFAMRSRRTAQPKLSFSY